ncbi:MAG: hypothetical protein DRQ42_08510 [Gammaproteobacteria bacterium]|nr:MAG: hypothetical protein DRQ42_08510 [Gammaproteobacteria bacterium]
MNANGGAHGPYPGLVAIDSILKKELTEDRGGPIPPHSDAVTVHPITVDKVVALGDFHADADEVVGDVVVADRAAAYPVAHDGGAPPCALEMVVLVEMGATVVAADSLVAVEEEAVANDDVRGEAGSAPDALVGDGAVDPVTRAVQGDPVPLDLDGGALDLHRREVLGHSAGHGGGAPGPNGAAVTPGGVNDQVRRMARSDQCSQTKKQTSGEDHVSHDSSHPWVKPHQYTTPLGRSLRFPARAKRYRKRCHPLASRCQEGIQ